MQREVLVRKLPREDWHGVWQYGEDVWGRLSLQGRPPLLVQPAVRSKARRRRGQGSLAASPRPTDIGAGCTSSESFAHPLFKDKERQNLRSKARRKGVTASQPLAHCSALGRGESWLYFEQKFCTQPSTSGSSNGYYWIAPWQLFLSKVVSLVAQ